MPWAALFDQAETYDVDVTEIREALATRREEQTE
jgi:hypothetical protein